MGLSEAVSEETFSAFDYALFGHLHHPFAVDSEKSFYSGSLLKYSFSEHKQPKGCRIIDTDKERYLLFRWNPGMMSLCIQETMMQLSTGRFPLKITMRILS
jgi:DNA repair exonuclease